MDELVIVRLVLENAVVNLFCVLYQMSTNVDRIHALRFRCVRTFLEVLTVSAHKASTIKVANAWVQFYALKHFSCQVFSSLNKVFV